MLKKVIILLLLLLSPNVYADDINQCCVLDQRIEVASIKQTLESLSGKSTSVIDQYYINEQQDSHLIDSIYGVSGVVTKNITGLGSIRIRGARSFDTKYLFNDFPLRDPSHPQNSFGSFFGDTLSFGNSEIQILKGSSSVLYGSEAIGGVVDIVTWPVEGIESTTEYGSRQSFLQEVNHTDFTLAYADSIDYETKNLRLSHDFGLIKPFLLFQETEAPLHNAPFIESIIVHNELDENDRRKVRYFQTGVKVDAEPIEAKLSYSNSDRRFVFLPNSDGSGFWNDGSFTSEAIYFDINGNLYDTTIGYSHQHDFMGIESEGLDSDYTDSYQNDIYIEQKLGVENLEILLGSRYSIHEHSKDRFTYDVSTSYNISEYILRTHYGTGFRLPSLYEMHGAFLTDFGRFEIGNPSLSPERASSVDFGIERTFDRRITTGATVFHHTLTNRIDFISSSYANINGTLDTYGYEAFYEQFLFGNTSARISYTRTIQPSLIDVSPHSIEASIRTVRKDWSIVAQLGYRDSHEIVLFDIETFTLGRAIEDGYFTSNLTAKYKVNDNIEVYGRLENVLDETYFDGGYKKDGLSAFIGVTISG